MAGQRMLDVDEVTMFGRRGDRRQGTSLKIADPLSEMQPAHWNGAAEGEWKVQGSKNLKKKMQYMIRQELRRKDMMDEEQAMQVREWSFNIGEGGWQLAGFQWNFFHQWSLVCRTNGPSEFHQLI